MKLASPFISSLLAIIALSVSALAGPEIPALINYQGFVTDDFNAPLGGTGTVYDVEFRFYSSGTGGTPIWGEAQAVTIAEGQFSVLLGNGQAIDQTIPHDSLDAFFGGTVGDTGDVFLGITVNPASQTGSAEFSPRQQLVANPFALRAKSADVAQTVAAGGITSSAFVAGSITGGSGGAIADNSITAVDISTNGVGASEIAANAVTASEIAANAVTASEIAANAVGASEIATNAVGSDEIINSSITSSDVQNGSLTGADLNPNIDLSSTGSVSLTLRADTNNSTGEADHPSIHFVQDGGAISAKLGFFGPNGDGQPDNTFWVSAPKVEIGQWGGSVKVWGTVTHPSDRNLKNDFSPVDRDLVLERLLDLPITSWRYKANDSRRHVGPMAQDFHAAFDDLLNLNSEDTTIAPLDEVGVAFASIQALNDLVNEKDEEIAELEMRLKKIETLVGTLTQKQESIVGK